MSDSVPMELEPQSLALTPTADDIDLFQLNPQATTQPTMQVTTEVEQGPSSPKKLKLTDHSDSKFCKVGI